MSSVSQPCLDSRNKFCFIKKEQYVLVFKFADVYESLKDSILLLGSADQELRTTVYKWWFLHRVEVFMRLLFKYATWLGLTLCRGMVVFFLYQQFSTCSRWRITKYNKIQFGNTSNNDYYGFGGPKILCKVTLIKTIQLLLPSIKFRGSLTARFVNM